MEGLQSLGQTATQPGFQIVAGAEPRPHLADVVGQDTELTLRQGRVDRVGETVLQPRHIGTAHLFRRAPGGNQTGRGQEAQRATGPESEGPGPAAFLDHQGDGTFPAQFRHQHACGLQVQQGAGEQAVAAAGFQIDGLSRQRIGRAELRHQGDGRDQGAPLGQDGRVQGVGRIEQGAVEDQHLGPGVRDALHIAAFGLFLADEQGVGQLVEVIDRGPGPGLLGLSQGAVGDDRRQVVGVQSAVTHLRSSSRRAVERRQRHAGPKRTSPGHAG